MTDEQHAEGIRCALRTLEKVIEAAREEGLAVTLWAIPRHGSTILRTHRLEPEIIRKL